MERHHYGFYTQMILSQRKLGTIRSGSRLRCRTADEQSQLFWSTATCRRYGPGVRRKAATSRRTPYRRFSRRKTAMTPVARRRRREEIKITIGPFRSHSDYGSCVDIQREVWRFEDIDLVPVATLMVVDHCGGIVLGAYSAIGERIGFVCSFFGSEDGDLIQ